MPNTPTPQEQDPRAAEAESIMAELPEQKSPEQFEADIDDAMQEKLYQVAAFTAKAKEALYADDTRFEQMMNSFQQSGPDMYVELLAQVVSAAGQNVMADAELEDDVKASVLVSIAGTIQSDLVAAGILAEDTPAPIMDALSMIVSQEFGGAEEAPAEEAPVEAAPAPQQQGIMGA